MFMFGGFFFDIFSMFKKKVLGWLSFSELRWVLFSVVVAFFSWLAFFLSFYVMLYSYVCLFFVFSWLIKFQYFCIAIASFILQFMQDDFP